MLGHRGKKEGPAVQSDVLRSRRDGRLAAMCVTGTAEDSHMGEPLSSMFLVRPPISDPGVKRAETDARELGPIT